MPTLIQDLYEEITHGSISLKTDKVFYHGSFDNLLKMIHCLSYNVYNNFLDVDFLNKVEFNKQCSQFLMNSENVNFLKSVSQRIRD